MEKSLNFTGDKLRQTGGGSGTPHNATDIATHSYLVIDDDVAAITLITRMLHDMGARRVDSVDDGEIVLKRITETRNRPDIIICALAIPKLDSVAFLRHLAEERFTGGLILMSSKPPRTLRIACELAEAHRLNLLGCLQKPFAPLALLNAISRFDGLQEKPLPLPPSFVTSEVLHKAIEQNQLVPFFQPKMDVKTGKIIGVEALARWRHPTRGIVLPALFIPVAEEHGLIGLLTKKILSKTFQHAAAWQKAGLSLSFAVNLSGLLLSDTDLPNRVANELHKAGIDPSDLTLEITESGLCKNMVSCLETLLSLHIKGIHLSIDDFGTGHSTLEQLHKMPFSELKIDRKFVTGAAQNDEVLAFFQSAVMLAKKLKLNTVAEGVETQEDLDVCAKLGCDVAQGFFIGRAAPGETFLKASQSRAGICRLTA